MVDMNDMWLQMRCEWYVSDMRAILLIWLIFFVNDIDMIEMWIILMLILLLFPPLFDMIDTTEYNTNEWEARWYREYREYREYVNTIQYNCYDWYKWYGRQVEIF